MTASVSGILTAFRGVRGTKGEDHSLHAIFHQENNIFSRALLRGLCLDLVQNRSRLCKQVQGLDGLSFRSGSRLWQGVRGTWRALKMPDPGVACLGLELSLLLPPTK